MLSRMSSNALWASFLIGAWLKSSGYQRLANSLVRNIWGFFSSRSRKTREKCISFDQFVLLSLYIFWGKNIIVDFIIQKLKSKCTSLKKYTNWAKLTYFSLGLREREEKKSFRTFHSWYIDDSIMEMVHEIRHVLFKKLFVSSDRISCQWALAFGSPFLNKVEDLILRILQAYCTFLDFFCKTRLTMMLNTPFTHQIQDLRGK